MLRTTSAVRVLGPADREAALAVCARDPVANVFVTSRLLEQGSAPTVGGEVWGYAERGQLVSLCWVGANLVPVQAGPAAVDAFATRAKRAGRHCSSIMGPADAVLGLWERLERSWWPAREVRPEQPLMVLDHDPLVAPDPLVRRAVPHEIDAVVPASSAMFVEEIGYSPVGRDGGVAYRASVAQLVMAGRTFVRMEPSGVPGGYGTAEVGGDARAGGAGRDDRAGGDGGAGAPGAVTTVFKADLGSVTPQVVQVQGVWLAPHLRGRGLAGPAMAAVCTLTRREVAPVLSLYVNGYNARAIAAYRRVGFRRVGTFATVLF